MKHATHCKFCKKPITIDVDDDYESIGDPHKLIPMAACNSCSDIRVERRVLESKIKKACMERVSTKRPSDEYLNKFRNLMEKLMKDYARMIARFHFMSGMAWDDECLELIVEHPAQWTEVLSRLWKIFSESNHSRA